MQLNCVFFGEILLTEQTFCFVFFLSQKLLLLCVLKINRNSKGECVLNAVEFHSLAKFQFLNNPLVPVLSLAVNIIAVIAASLSWRFVLEISSIYKGEDGWMQRLVACTSSSDFTLLCSLRTVFCLYYFGLSSVRA